MGDAEKTGLSYRISNLRGIKWLLLLIPLLFVVLTMVISLINIFQRSCFDESGFTLEY